MNNNKINKFIENLIFLEDYCDFWEEIKLKDNKKKKSHLIVWSAWG